MPNMIVDGGKFVLSQQIEAAGTLTRTLQTQNVFVDKNIDIVTVTPSAVFRSGATSISTSDVESILTEVESPPVSGEYIAVTAQGSIVVSTAGFIDANTSVDSGASTKYYTVQNAVFSANGPSVVTTQKGYVGAGVTVGTISSGVLAVTGGTLSSGPSHASISSAGYYDGTTYDTSDSVILETTEASGYYKIIGSGTATVNRAAIAKQVTTSGYFVSDADPVSVINSDSTTVMVAPEQYYIKKSTLSTNSVTSSETPQIVTISDGYYPTARTITVQPIAEIHPTTSLSDVGLSTYFDPGSVSNNSISLTPAYTSTGGYVAAGTNVNNGGVEYYKIKTATMTETTTTIISDTVTRGTASWTSGWMTADVMDVATFANMATSGVTYVDISNTTSAPALISGSYLFINAGYTDNLKISLAKLVPDGSDVKGHSEYILTGHTAYDDDGELVTGSIPTYAGAYTVT